MIKQNTIPEVFHFYPAKGELIGILSIPHSGEILPDEFKKYLTPEVNHLMQDVDYRVHELIDLEELNNAGVCVLYTTIIRTAVDLNREASKAVLNWEYNSKGVKLVTDKPPKELEEQFLGKYYWPYYEFIKTCYHSLLKTTAIPSLVDLHSMPSKAEAYHLKSNPNQKIERPNFCLSDGPGKTCEEEYIKFFGEQLSKSYPEVTYNDPYIGGNITQYLDKTLVPLNNIQIEISRAVYMDEITKQLNKDAVKKLKPILTKTLIDGFKRFYKN